VGAGSFVTFPGGFPLMSGGECVIAETAPGHNRIEIGGAGRLSFTGKALFFHRQTTVKVRGKI
jgi:hypothetical protein